MKLNELQYTEGSRQKHFRKGRGLGSGNGKNAGSGNKGQNSRSGGGVALGFEGGQMPLWRRLPKRGFKNVNHKEFAVVNVEVLNRYENGTVVSAARLIEDGIIKAELDGLKVLGKGKLEKSLTVQANKFSASAQEAIVNAGGKAEVL